ncbi:MAG: hypothetical protein HYU78_14960 [Rhodocyclales bacterium]|nr:hypothetical protein [Rhodocyclales bacterium]
MMDFDKCKQEATRSKISVVFEASDRGPSLLSNEALFHIPLLAAVVLTLACLSRKPRTAEIGQMVGECIERTFTNFKGSSQRLGWSANLRIRTVAALAFLESANLVTVAEKGIISATDLGRKVIKSAFAEDDDLSFTLMTVERSYRDICGERRSQLELL